VPPQAVTAWPSLRSLDAGSAGFYAGARHGVARGGTCAASGDDGLAVALLARRGLRRLPRCRASQCGARRHVCRLRRRRLGCRCARSTRAAPASTLPRVTVWREVARVPPQAAAALLSLRSLDAGCAGFYAGARHAVARGGTCAASGGGGLAVPALARRGLRRLLRCRASQCGASWHVCRLRRRRLGCRCARSTRAAPASTLARVTLWREVAHVPPQAVTAWPSLRSLDAGCAGSYAGARHGVWREEARSPPQAVTAWLSLRSLDAGRAGFYAGARHGVARGGSAASGGDGLAVAALARRGLRRLLRWRASRCGARRHVCRLRR
jgi:hypothetical protein